MKTKSMLAVAYRLVADSFVDKVDKQGSYLKEFEND